MPLGRRHERLVLVVALLLASAGIAMAATTTERRHTSAPVANATTTTTSTTLAPTTSTTAQARVWAETADCIHAEADRPAVLSYSINGAQGLVPYPQALRMAKAAGIPTGNLVRQGATLWWGYAEATGTVGSLLGPARRLLAAHTDTLWTSAQIYCAHHNRNTDQLWVLLRPEADPAAIPARHGFSDVLSQVTDRSGGRITAYLTTFAPLAVEHAIAYLDDDEVLAALPSSNCPVAAAAGALSVPKDLLPTTSTPAPTTTSTSTTMRPYVMPQYDYSSGSGNLCGVQVT